MSTRFPWPGKNAVRLAVGAAGLLVLAGAFLLPVQEWVTQAGAYLAQHGPAGAAVYALLFVLCAIGFVPTSPLSLVAGLLYGPWGILLAWCCVMLAAALSLPTMRHLLRTSAETMLKSRPRLRLVSEVIADEGWRAVLLVRLSGGAPFGVQNCILAATKVQLLPYLLATSVGILPGVALSAGVGAFGQAAIEGAGSLRVGVLMLGVLAAITLVLVSAAKVRARLAEIER